jgi:surface antigen
MVSIFRKRSCSIKKIVPHLRPNHSLSERPARRITKGQSRAGVDQQMFRIGRAAALTAAILLGGCANGDRFNNGPKEGTGTLFGALSGALIGSAIGGTAADRVAATVAGAAIGGLIGNRIGAAMDEEDRRLAYQAQIEALEQTAPGAPVGWRNPGTGRHGNIVPGPVYVQRGLQCRGYTHTVYIDAKPQIARGTACKNPDGTWTAVS